MGVLAFDLGRRVGVNEGENSMRRLSDRLSVARIGYYRREFYQAELARRTLRESLRSVRAANTALEDRTRGIASMARLAAAQVIHTLDAVPKDDVRGLLRAAEVLSEVADAQDLVL